jgi:hypothetical protein
MACGHPGPRPGVEDLGTCRGTGWCGEPGCLGSVPRVRVGLRGGPGGAARSHEAGQRRKGMTTERTEGGAPTINQHPTRPGWIANRRADGGDRLAGRASQTIWCASAFTITRNCGANMSRIYRKRPVCAIRAQPSTSSSWCLALGPRSAGLGRSSTTTARTAKIEPTG